MSDQALAKGGGGFGGGGSGVYYDRRYAMNCNTSRLWDEMTAAERKCLEERKYWCFLLSSIVTFCLSMLLVVSWRIVAHVCCRQRDKEDKVHFSLLLSPPILASPSPLLPLLSTPTPMRHLSSSEGDTAPTPSSPALSCRRALASG